MGDIGEGSASPRGFTPRVRSLQLPGRSPLGFAGKRLAPRGSSWTTCFFRARARFHGKKTLPGVGPSRGHRQNVYSGSVARGEPEAGQPFRYVTICEVTNTVRAIETMHAAAPSEYAITSRDGKNSHAGGQRQRRKATVAVRQPPFNQWATVFRERAPVKEQATHFLHRIRRVNRSSPSHYTRRRSLLPY
ncbi:hypothetical protein MRX96_011125 [Rhipicephalus microplus]